jgi:uncharacterized damage-inducible protein DinB
MPKLLSLVLAVSLLAVPVRAQADIKATIVQHLRTSKDFTIKVAQAMPEADYSFKLTPAQMSFAEQMTHLAQALSFFTGIFTEQKPAQKKSTPTNKADIVAFVTSAYDRAIEIASTVTPEQMAKTYQTGEGSKTGLDMLLGALDHSTHHRASAEMYLRAKGITPPTYEFCKNEPNWVRLVNCRGPTFSSSLAKLSS